MTDRLDDDMLAVGLTRAQWNRTMDVLGESGNDAIAGDIAIALAPTSKETER